MKRTLQVVSAALLLTVASVTAQAQGGGGGGGGRGAGGGGWERQKTMLLKDITLSPAVATSIDSIATAATAKTAELRKDVQQGTPPSDELRAKMTAVTTDRNAAIKKLLTPEQATQFDKNVAEMATMGRGRGGL